MSVSVLKPGLLSSLQDGGRKGYAALGVGRAGAMDIPAWRLANALVGNVAGEAVIECTLLGPTLRFERAATIALTGAPIAARVGDQALPLWTCCCLPAGSVLQLGGMVMGCRSYLSVRGGFNVPLLLGSRSSDLHAHIGYGQGQALQRGDSLPMAASSSDTPATELDQLKILRWGLDPQPWFDFGNLPIALLPGSHADQLTDDAREALYSQPFVLSKDSNRTGGRLDGPRLQLQTTLELISEGSLPGTIQLPPSGQPIVLLGEAPVTGGYPRIGQVTAVDMPRLAQKRPGDRLRFQQISLAEACHRLAVQNQQLERLITVIQRRLAHG